MKWIKYPENNPAVDKYYFVKNKDGTINEACWWGGGWYCYERPFDVIAFSDATDEEAKSFFETEFQQEN